MPILHEMQGIWMLLWRTIPELGMRCLSAMPSMPVSIYRRTMEACRTTISEKRMHPGKCSSPTETETTKHDTPHKMHVLRGASDLNHQNSSTRKTVHLDAVRHVDCESEIHSFKGRAQRMPLQALRDTFHDDERGIKSFEHMREKASTVRIVIGHRKISRDAAQCGGTRLTKSAFRSIWRVCKE